MKVYRIFMAIGGKATPGDNNYMWVKNLYDPLVEEGHDVFLLNIDDYALQHGLPYMSVEAKELLSNELPSIFNNEHEKKPFDIFFSYFHNGQIIPEVLKEIKKKVFTINYSTNFHQFEMYKEVAQIVDLNIYISKIAKSGFDKLGVKSYWMPLAANPSFYQPSAKKNDDAVFIGSVYGSRAYLFWRLLQYNLNIQLYGKGWKEEKPQLDVISNTQHHSNKSFKTSLKNLVTKVTGYEIRKASFRTAPILDKSNVTPEDQLREYYGIMNDQILKLLRSYYPENLHTSLSDDHYVKVLSEAGIVINIQESRFNHDYFNHRVLFGSNLRDYEATMCRSFLCTQYSDEITELFDVGKEIVCYNNEHDLAEKINYYTKNTSERDRIAEAGYRKSIKQHTWNERFKGFFDYVDLSNR